jgi:hypothetical protein
MFDNLNKRQGYETKNPFKHFVSDHFTIAGV